MKDKVLEAAREKWCIMFREKTIQMTVDFSCEIRETRRKWYTILKVWKKSTVNYEFYVAEISFKNEGK